MAIQTLENMGFDKKTANLYLAALEIGPTTIQNLAKKTRLPRSSTYLLIDELKEKGLISQTKLGKKTVFTPASPEKLIQIANIQKQRSVITFSQLKKTLPQLLAVYNQQPRKPNLWFYESFEGIKTILEETLKAKEILVMCGGYKNPIEKKLTLYLDQYFDEVDRQGIKTYEILGEAPDLDDYLKKFQSPFHRIKKINLSITNLFHIDKLIFGNKLAIISYVYLNGVVIENKQITDFEKALFWQLWQSLKKEQA